MYSIKLNIDDSILDKVMLFLDTIPKKNIEVKKLDNSYQSDDEKLGDFFLKSPLNGITIEREHEIYNQRVEF